MGMRFQTALFFALVTSAFAFGCSDLFVDIPQDTEEGDNAPACLQDSDCTKKPNRYCKATAEAAQDRCSAAFTMAQPGQCTVLPTDGCSKDFVPVCGCDGKVYTNACTATQTQKKNRNVSEESPQWAPSTDIAGLTRSWQTETLTLQDEKAGTRHLVLRYVFAQGGQFELQMLDGAHINQAAKEAKQGTYAVAAGGTLKLSYAGEVDANGVARVGELHLEQICTDGLRITGHDGMPNTDLELHPTPAASPEVN